MWNYDLSKKHYRGGILLHSAPCSRARSRGATKTGGRLRLPPGSDPRYDAKLRAPGSRQKIDSMATVHQLKPGATPKLRVLVVEDNLDSVHAMAMLVKMMGHEVQFAINGFAAL